MRLFHAFPRPPHRKDAAGRLVRDPPTDEDHRKGLEVLRLILTHGLLCTPEKFKLFPNYKTENLEKLKFLRANTHHDEIVQSRACFTLMDAHELNQSQPSREATHIDLFGAFAIGLDPLEARDLGITPTVYYYRHHLGSQSNRTAGLAAQIVERLDEIRSVFSVLSFIEGKASAGRDEAAFPSAEKLKSMGIRIRFQNEIEAELAKLRKEEAELIFRLLNTDRVPAWNLVDFIEIMLSLYQTTDSTLEDAPMAFFHEKEWRLVHHMMTGLVWFGLGQHSTQRNPWANEFKSDIQNIRNFIRFTSRKTDDQLNWFLNHSWVLAGTEELHFREFVREIVVPRGFCHEAQRIVDSLPFTSARPVIVPAPAKWRIKTDKGIPQIVLAGD